ncbi:MAG TPA: hypothetical protein VMV69_17740 [Pirellulales bacterium]|nr:hypothetical protein [Pirellulales bacterium]
MSTWTPANLTRHHQKRITKDQGCFEDLLAINGRTMTKAEYEQRSQDAVATAWGEYEAQGRDVARMSYYPKAALFVDNELVVAVTDLGRAEFLTCFHEHFDVPHGIDPGPGASLSQSQLRYKQKLQNDERCGMIIHVRRIRGV